MKICIKAGKFIFLAKCLIAAEWVVGMGDERGRGEASCSSACPPRTPWDKSPTLPPAGTMLQAAAPTASLAGNRSV